MIARLPNPSEILEQLADKVVSQIDALSVVGFDAALDEMLRYHRFLVSAYATQTITGAPFNYAELGGYFRHPHEEWIGQYRRLFERAISRIGDDTIFAAGLGRVPLRLLPEDADFSNTIVLALLDLGPIFVHRLEAWVTKRTTIEATPGEIPSPRLTLAGSDSKAYEGVVMEFVGAWESLGSLAPTLYGWKKAKSDANASWSALSRSWPYLYRHVRNTAYFVAAAVWNEDEIGTAQYLDALLRWPVLFFHQLPDHIRMREERMILPDLLALEWPDATQAVRHIRDDFEGFTPRKLFASVVRTAHRDVMLLTAGVMIHWYMNGKQPSDLALSTAIRLRRQERDVDPELDPGYPRAIKFVPLLLDIMRLQLMAKYREGTYGDALDQTVGMLDGMTERRVVPGRVYSPSTSDRRDDLLFPFLAMLLASLGSEVEDEVLEEIDRFAEGLESLEDPDEKSRSFLVELRRIEDALKTPPEFIGRGISGLAPDADVPSLIEQARRIFGEAIRRAEERRIARIASLPIDQAKLEKIRQDMEQGITTSPAEILIFKNFDLARSKDNDSAVPPARFSVTPISKGYFTEPQVDTDSRHLNELLVAAAQRGCAREVISKFLNRPREHIAIDADISDVAFWKAALGFVHLIKEAPTLWISRTRHVGSMLRFLRGVRDGSLPFAFERKREHGLGSYLGTIEGIDVFTSEWDIPETPLLFSSTSLRSILYRRVRSDDVILALNFEPDASLISGSLTGEFVQEVLWDESAIIELNPIASTSA